MSPSRKYISLAQVPEYTTAYNRFCAQQIMAMPKPDFPTYFTALTEMTMTPLPVYMSREQIIALRNALYAKNIKTPEALRHLLPSHWQRKQVATSLIQSICATEPKDDVLTCPEIWIMFVNAALPEREQRDKQELTSFLVPDIGYDYDRPTHTLDR